MKPRSPETAQRFLDRARLLRTLEGNPGWKALTEMVEDGLDKRRKRLCSFDCKPDEVDRLRVEIDCMQSLLSASQIRDSEIEALETRVAFLRKQEKMREDLGMVPDFPSEVNR